MKLVVDANILFAALIKNGVTRRLWLCPDVELYAPSFLYAEISKHERMLEEKYAGYPPLAKLAALLLKRVKFVSDSSFEPFLPAAASLLRDEKDWSYLAAALALNASVWSNDAGFKKQRRVRVFSTAELAEDVGPL